MVSGDPDAGQRAPSRAAGAPAISYLNAALRVLADFHRPMRIWEITEEALRRGLVKPAGKTPEASMSAALYRYARDHPQSQLERLYEPGGKRPRPGSVRWALREVKPS
jgi:HB1, ASXL, restriction endonuclease HTH domain